MNTLDVITTYLAGLYGGVEINPLVNMILNTGGYWLFSIVKVVVISIASVILIKVSKIQHETINFKRAVIIATNVFNVFLLYVVVHHFIGSYL
jgi:hypothetical protein